uniref:Uncharacterized protein n=1 Tax=Haptolina brevifila TaxID=156173 RepID=A0A7S2H3M7_9EUKA|mmetsp:Transcript_50818/g.101136  ORF Transcript_50818/g.101136 Transcript_50818/m.101136 type:complete len:111 (+) Transcript_50818:881-1213(+)
MLQKAKEDASKLAASTHDEAIEQQLLILDSIQPAQLLEMVQQQLGQLVMLGTVTALGVSSRAYGLRYGLLPVLAALVPGVPISFAIVFYFLLETRNLQAGGTLLPLHALP